MTTLAVTLGRTPTDAHRERAQQLAARFGAPLLARQSFAKTAASVDADTLYVVGRNREEILDVHSGKSMHVQQGLLRMKLQQGQQHPLLRTIDGATSVLDATMGLAADALHITVARTDVRVVGVEAMPVVHALLEDGLRRFAADPTLADAATRMSVVHAQAEDYLAAQPARSIDVVMLDPMMNLPINATPAMLMLRRFANNASPTAGLLMQAARVAKLRVVLKLAKRTPPPPHLVFDHREYATEAIYHVHHVNAATS
jgi:16S rRNA (guanine1516-N2)-methyltransferase